MAGQRGLPGGPGAASAPGELTLLPEVWAAIEARAAGADLVLSLRTLRNDDTIAARELRLTIAPAPFTGKVYYNSYNARSASPTSPAAFQAVPSLPWATCGTWTWATA